MSKKAAQKAQKAPKKALKEPKKASKKAGVAAGNVQLYKALRAEGIKKRTAARVAKKISATPVQPVAATLITPVPEAPPIDAPMAEVPVAEAPEAEAAAPPAFDTWTKAELLAHAREQDLPGRSTMSKGELLEALRASEHVSA